jgi:hypothetical protein
MFDDVASTIHQSLNDGNATGAVIVTLISGTEKYACKPCPPGGNCSGLGIEDIGALPGYSRVSRSTTKFTGCTNPVSCLGGRELHSSTRQFILSVVVTDSLMPLNPYTCPLLSST